MRFASHTARPSRLPADMSVAWYAAPILSAAGLAAAILLAGIVRGQEEPAWSKRQPKAATYAVNLSAPPTTGAVSPQAAAPAAAPR